jgi:dephospho-CoA kinase
MIVLGLTGGIGMGKSTTARLFADEGVPVWDADATVHQLYAPGGAAVAPVLERFPDSGSPVTGIERFQLSDALLRDPDGFADLNAIVHPLVAEDRERFMAEQERAGAAVVLLDIPLLYENKLDALCDKVVLVTAPEEVRRDRVLARPGMTPEKLNAILSRQMSVMEKRSRADAIIWTDAGIDDARSQVRVLLDVLLEKGMVANRRES